jgi:hypothetical protein
MNVHFDKSGNQLGTSANEADVVFGDETYKEFIENYDDDKSYKYNVETKKVTKIDKIDRGSAKDEPGYALFLEQHLVQQTRKESYPNIGDQLDMQYWDQVNDTTIWKDAVAKVKSDNPKPS